MNATPKHISALIMTETTQISRQVNGTLIEQRVTDGFINGTVMCASHSINTTNDTALIGKFDRCKAGALLSGMNINPAIFVMSGNITH